jgi:hypothetical protein
MEYYRAIQLEGDKTLDEDDYDMEGDEIDSIGDISAQVEAKEAGD